MQKEKEKIDRIIEGNPDLHPFTVEALKEAKKQLCKKNLIVQDIKSFSDEDIHNIRKAIETRNEITKILDEDIIKPNELEAINNSLRENLKERKKDQYVR